jgi:hypothetical protein
MKLIDLLVKELPKRGGWPEGALNATQDKDGEVCFSSSATPEFGYAAWEGGDWCGNEFYTITADDYDTAIITRAQYEAALAAIKAVVGHNGWVQWAGGECPVDSDAIVEVRYRKTNPYQYNNDRAGDFYWAHTGSCGDIIAYRVHDKGINHRANDNRLDQDLNECIGQDVAPEWRGEGEMRWWLIERWGFSGGLRRYGFTFARYYFARARHRTMRDMDIIRISERSLSCARSSR